MDKVFVENSQDICIPKAIIEQAGLWQKKLEFHIVNEGILLRPASSSPRAGWAEAFSRHAENISKDTDWLEAPLVSDKDWEW